MALAAAEPIDADASEHLIGLDRAELAQILRGLGEPERTAPMRARQLWHWLYHRGVTDPAMMTSLPQGLRERLAARYRCARPFIVDDQESADGTRKWLLRFGDGREVETVYIPEPDRGAVCISTQVGCSLTCSFCHTGTMPLVRNLHAREILAQLMVARDALGEWPTRMPASWCA